MRIYGLDVKDRLRTLNRSKNFTYTILPANAHGYGAYDRYRTTIEPLATKKGLYKPNLKLY
jgi:hypothetical protein